MVPTAKNLLTLLSNNDVTFFIPPSKEITNGMIVNVKFSGKMLSKQQKQMKEELILNTFLDL